MRVRQVLVLAASKVGTEIVMEGILRIGSLFCTIVSIIAVAIGRWDAAAWFAVWALICKYEANELKEMQE